MLEILIWTTVIIVVLVGILLYFSRLKKTGRWGWGLPTLSGGGIGGFFSKYAIPAVLFIVLCFVLALTDHELGWWSFLTRDGKTFTALVVTYFVFASAFIQDKEKKAPFYQKVMVFTMIIAVDMALMGSPFGLWDKYGWKGAEQSRSVVETFTPKQSPVTRTVNIIATQGAFTEVKIPPATDFRWDVQEGCLIAVAHDGDPGGSIYDCTEHIELGTYLHNLRIGFSSKTETPVKIAVKLTPL